MARKKFKRKQNSENEILHRYLQNKMQANVRIWTKVLQIFLSSTINQILFRIDNKTDDHFMIIKTFFEEIIHMRIRDLYRIIFKIKIRSNNRLSHTAALGGGGNASRWPASKCNAQRYVQDHTRSSILRETEGRRSEAKG